MANYTIKLAERGVTKGCHLVRRRHGSAQGLRMGLNRAASMLRVWWLSTCKRLLTGQFMFRRRGLAAVQCNGRGHSNRDLD